MERMSRSQRTSRGMLRLIAMHLRWRQSGKPSRRSPASVNIGSKRRRFCSRMGKFRRAEAMILKSIQFDPMHAHTWEKWGDLYEYDDRLKKALRLYDIAALLDGGENAFYTAEDIREELTPTDDFGPP